jgi:ribose transport system permease protein
MASENKKGLKRSSRFKIAESTLLFVLFLACAYWLNNYLFTYPVLVSILKGAALISVLAMAESIVLACGGIDLSVASIGLLSSSIIYYMVEKNITDVLPAVVLSLIIGACFGMLNGLFISKIKVHPIIVTMATGLLASGISGAVTNNIVIFDTAQQFAFFKSVPVFVFPVSLIIALIIMALCFAVFRYTTVGRQVFAVGGSEEAAKLSGLNVDRIKIYSYCVAGVLGAVGGMMVLADSTLAARFYGAGADLEVIFAAIIGGVSLYSGGRIFFRVCIGAGVISVINRVVYGLFVFNNMRAIIIGILILITIAFRKNIFKRSKAE